MCSVDVLLMSVVKMFLIAGKTKVNHSFEDPNSVQKSNMEESGFPFPLPRV